MNIADAGITAIFGYVVVFAGLLILMAVISGMGAYFKAKEKAPEISAETAKKETSPNKIPKLVKVNKPVAKGSAGHVKLYDVPDKEAAMIMAIVADTMQKPINELHFISIREVK
ncbi:MAG: OadG family protein [Muribaculaceae bacterium]|nr:OadG family protein [Alistipes senegalensis]MCM1474509.1 OadG family protein [Muribaculaceae bacterium]MDE6426844.1 OadG family protein [Ruminococcus sp.]